MNNKHIKLLKKAYKQEKDAKRKERILIVLYSLQGETSRAVGERIQCDQKLVLYWKKRYLSEGLKGLSTRPRSGKPRKLSQKQEKKLIETISKEDPIKPWTTKRVQDLIKKESGVSYTQRHVQRILHRWNLSLVTPRPTFWQKASGEEIKRFWKKNTLLQEKIS